MTVKTAVGAADDEDREPDLIGTVREETDDEGYFAIWIKVGRAVSWAYTGFRSDERPDVIEEWICIHSSDDQDHGKRVYEKDVLDFPIVGAVPNTPAHTQRMIKAAREMQDDVVQRFRKVAQRPSERMLQAFRDRPGKDRR